MQKIASTPRLQVATHPSEGGQGLRQGSQGVVRSHGIIKKNEKEPGHPEVIRQEGPMSSTQAPQRAVSPLRPPQGQRISVRGSCLALYQQAALQRQEKASTAQ